MELKTLEQQFTGNARLLLPFLQDTEVTDLLINGTKSFFIEKEGTLRSEKNPFEDLDQIRNWIERLLVPIHKRVDAKMPYVDGRLLDGSRFHLIMPPLAVDGPFISIRKKRPTFNCALETFGNPEVIAWLKEQMAEKKNMLIAGSTGSGKTTLLSRCLELVPPTERIAIIEETKEIEVSHPHVLHLEGRPPTPEGVGEISLRVLLKNALRMRPDRLILGEARGEEAFDMLQALNTGHKGSLGTLHASSAQDALRRLEALALLSGVQVPHRVIREWIAANIQIVVFLEKEAGRRQIKEVLTLHGLEGEKYRVSPLHLKLLKAY